MGGDLDARCAVLARAHAEPMGGTAPAAAGWVCVEQRGAWPRSVDAHPEPAVAALAARAAAAGWRLLLIRQPGRVSEVGSRARVFLADTAPAVARTTTFTVDGPDDLAGIPLSATRGEPVSGGLLMVCTHGRRDRCCALDGRALVTAVAGPGVWECSHLGGHRFAPTALVLPTGYLYGRLDPATAVSAVKAAGLGEVEAQLCRGRSAWTPAGQVAELAVRTATGLREAAAVVVEDGAGPEIRVAAADGRRWAVPVREATGAAAPTSCGAAALPAAHWHADHPRLLP